MFFFLVIILRMLHKDHETEWFLCNKICRTIWINQENVFVFYTFILKEELHKFKYILFLFSSPSKQL